MAEVVLTNKATTELLGVKLLESCILRSSASKVIVLFKSSMGIHLFKVDKVKEVNDDSAIAVSITIVCTIEAEVVSIVRGWDGCKQSCHVSIG